MRDIRMKTSNNVFNMETLLPSIEYANNTASKHCYNHWNASLLLWKIGLIFTNHWTNFTSSCSCTVHVACTQRCVSTSLPIDVPSDLAIGWKRGEWRLKISQEKEKNIEGNPKQWQIRSIQNSNTCPLISAVTTKQLLNIDIWMYIII